PDKIAALLPTKDKSKRALEHLLTPETTNYTYDGLNVFKEYGEHGEPLAQYYSADGDIVARKMFGNHGRKMEGYEGNIEDHGKLLYYMTDAIGNVMDVTNKEGETAMKYRYDAFGNLFTQMAAPHTNAGFAGKTYDSKASLMDYSARWYSPKVGRFTTEDTYAGAAYVPQTLNRYAYTLNNPVNYTDPTGHWCEYGEYSHGGDCDDPSHWVPDPVDNSGGSGGSSGGGSGDGGSSGGDPSGGSSGGDSGGNSTPPPTPAEIAALKYSQIFNSVGVASTIKSAHVSSGAVGSRGEYPSLLSDMPNTTYGNNMLYALKTGSLLAEAAPQIDWGEYRREGLKVIEGGAKGANKSKSGGGLLCAFVGAIIGVLIEPNHAGESQEDVDHTRSDYLGLPYISPKEAEENKDQNGYLYRALNEKDYASLSRNLGLEAKNPSGSWSLSEHVVWGSNKVKEPEKNDPWISTTLSLQRAQFYNDSRTSYGVIKIDTSKIESAYYYAPVSIDSKFQEYNKAVAYATIDQEVSIYQYLNRNAIIGWIPR
ncbi:RHS repeat-associated core domain-containing protein, partial [Paenibacillus alginolyticus]|uniref:RHS repeat-associated core domain-containing protein n=1 Tax=Paenibacillus alginolyticus TaxID=59839 RepID=UPI0022843C63